MHAQHDDHEGGAVEGEAKTPFSIPAQKELTKSVMNHWPDHQRIRKYSGYAETRGDRLRPLHCTMKHPAVSTAPADTAGSSILAADMVDDAGDEGEETKPRDLKWTYSAFLSNTLVTSGKDAVFSADHYSSFMSQFLGEPIPAIAPLARARATCACQLHTIDAHGDHIHTCPKHSGAKPAHELVVAAVADLARAAGFSTRTRNVTATRGRQRGDIEILRLNVGGHANMVIDVTILHEMSGNCNGINVGLNGQLRGQGESLLEDAAKAKNKKYRETYASSGIQKAFIPAVLTTAGRIHGEFLRLLWILADRETRKNFDNLGPAGSPSAEAFKWKRAFNFNKNRAIIARTLAQATALRAQLVMTALRPRRDDPHLRNLNLASLH